MPDSSQPVYSGPSDPGTSWVARYGQVILGDGIAAIPRALFLYQAKLDLSAQEVWFIAAILSHKWDGLLPRPSLKQIARESGVTVKWLRELRAALEAKGYLEVAAAHQANGAQMTNTYDFGALFSRLEDFIRSGSVDDEAQDPDDLQIDITNGADRSFTARFGRVILREGIAAIPQALFHHQVALGIKPQHLWFICYVLSFRWSTALPHPSLRGMAARTGYSVRQIHNLKDELIAQNYLTLVHRHNNAGQDTNGYDFALLFDRLITLLRPAEEAKLHLPEDRPPAPLSKRRGKYVKNAPTDALTTPDGGTSPIHEVGSTVSVSGEGYQQFIVRGTVGSLGGTPIVHQEGAPSVHQGGTSGSSGRDTAVALRGSTPSSHEKEPTQEESTKEEDSNRVDRQKKGADEPPYSAYIAGVVLDYSREWGDLLNRPSNVTQALRIWQESGLGEEAFVEKLHEARKRTRHAQGAQGQGYIVNKMAYFFTTLRSLIEVGQELQPGKAAPRV